MAGYEKSGPAVKEAALPKIDAKKAAERVQNTEQNTALSPMGAQVLRALLRVCVQFEIMVGKTRIRIVDKFRSRSAYVLVAAEGAIMDVGILKKLHKAGAEDTENMIRIPTAVPQKSIEIPR